MVLQQDAKLAEKYKGPCCGSQGGAGLDLFRKKYAVQLQGSVPLGFQT